MFVWKHFFPDCMFVWKHLFVCLEVFLSAQSWKSGFETLLPDGKFVICLAYMSMCQFVSGWEEDCACTSVSH